MVFGIVQRHDGDIDVISAPGQGTTVRLTFPPAPADVGPPPAEDVVPKGAPLRILAVDDEPALGNMIMLMLEPAGHTVAVAASGEEALQWLAAETFDILLADVGLGEGMNGWELAAQVRKRYPTVRVVLASGWGAAIDPDEARREGIHAVVAKPYRVANLERMLAEVEGAHPSNGNRA
jgi:CheY-like chemotaxis protein